MFFWVSWMRNWAKILDSFCSCLQQCQLGESTLTMSMQPTRGTIERSIILVRDLMPGHQPQLLTGTVGSGARWMSMVVSGNLAPGSGLLRMLVASPLCICHPGLYSIHSASVFAPRCVHFSPLEPLPPLKFGPSLSLTSHKSSCLLWSSRPSLAARTDPVALILDLFADFVSFPIPLPHSPLHGWLLGIQCLPHSRYLYVSQVNKYKYMLNKSFNLDWWSFHKEVFSHSPLYFMSHQHSVSKCKYMFIWQDSVSHIVGTSICHMPAGIVELNWVTLSFNTEKCQ